MERRFAVLDLLKDSVERLAEDLRAFLNKDKLVSGEAEQKAKQVLIAIGEETELRREIPAIWNRMLEQPDEELVELIGSRVYEKLNLRPDKGQIVAVLRGKPVPKKPKVPPSRDEPADRPRDSRRPSVKPVAIVLWGERYPVGSHKEILQKVVHLLYEKHGHEFDKALELKGRKWKYMSTDRAELGAEGPSKSDFRVESSSITSPTTAAQPLCESALGRSLSASAITNLTSRSCSSSGQVLLSVRWGMSVRMVTEA